MSEGAHDHGCDKRKVYTDDRHYFWFCYCQAVALNTFAGGNIKHRDAWEPPTPQEDAP